MTNPATLLEISLAQQEARHAAALAAMRSRSADIAELDRLAAALTARGFAVRPQVDVQPVGALAVCHLVLCASCSLAQFGELQDWLAVVDITLTREPGLDIDVIRAYQLGLRGQQVRLNLTITDRTMRRFAPSPPAAA